MIVVSGFNVYPNELEDGGAPRRRVRGDRCAGESTGEAIRMFVVRSNPISRG